MRSFAVGTLLALASAVFAADSDTCSSSDGFTINSQADLDKLSSCSTLTGDVTVSSTSADTITFNGINSIKGDLEVSSNFLMTSLSFPSLVNVTGEFYIFNNTRLNNFAAPTLVSVDELTLSVLPNLQQLQFNSAINSSRSITVTDTQLSSIDGINGLRTVQSISITNNNYIQNVSMPHLTEVDTSLSINFNAKGVDVWFPSLVSAGNISFQDVGSVEISSLRNVSGSFGCNENVLERLSAPRLQYVTNSLSIVNNSDLTALSFPQLETIGGGFVIANNSELEFINGFGSLEEVGGAVDFTGDFSKVSLPELTDVKGGLNIQTTASNFTCPFKSNSGVVKGHGFVCESTATPERGVNGTNTSDPDSSATSSSTSSKTSATASSSSTSAAISIMQTGSAFSVLSAVAAAVLALL